MALSYSDVYRVATYGPRVKDIGEEIQKQKAEGSNVIFFARQKIQEQIDTLKEKEARIFSLLGVKDINELNKRIKDFQEATINFNGSALYSNFIGILEAQNQREFIAFDKAVNEVINKEVLNDVNNYIEREGKDTAVQQVLHFLNTEGFTQSKRTTHQYYSKKGMSTIQFFPNSFTRNQQKKWKEILKSYAKKEGYNDVKNWDLTVNSHDDSLQVDFTWFNAISNGGNKPLSKTEAVNLDDKIILEINNTIKNKILEYVGKDRDLISDIIDEILSTQDGKYAFFVGRNTNAIEGILGEIQGMYYIRKLLGTNYYSTGNIVRWRGGTREGVDSTNPHQDLQIVSILGEAFGIQIKNTTSELEIKNDLKINTKRLDKEVTFTKGTISNIVSKMQQIAPIDDGISGLLETYYGTLKFNVPYHRDKRRKKGERFRPGLRMKDKNAPEYKDLHDQLLGYQSQIDSLLSIFAAAFMYLDAFDFSQGGDFNSLYLIGGAAFITASSVLETVLENLNDETREPHFNVALEASGSNTIIDALNSGKSGSPYTDAVLADIKLTSSYKF